jgi:hypothetical protein
MLMKLKSEGRYRKALQMKSKWASLSEKREAEKPWLSVPTANMGTLL